MEQLIEKLSCRPFCGKYLRVVKKLVVRDYYIPWTDTILITPSWAICPASSFHLIYKVNISVKFKKFPLARHIQAIRPYLHNKKLVILIFVKY